MGAGRGLAAALNCYMRDEHKEVRDGITGEGQELSEEDESRINEAAGDVNDGLRGADALVVHQASLQMQQQQAIVRWERFLPLRTLNVLLVEIDDSTRQVVSALLRNCSYEVIAAANGLQAWKILEDLTNRVDLVLTEVVMPCLSGVGLLCNIMNHKSRKDIPVIMMSSNDSMGIVFKCLSKGAVDFLVKPIRKNELRNLWQHVWRRCHISSCSGSASGVQTKKLAKSRSADDSDNYTGSNDEDANDSIGLKTRDGSDNGSETQSSWTKHAVEIDSPQPMSPSAQLCGPHDSTCAQAIHPNIEPFCNGWMSMTTNMECQEQNAIADLEIGVPRNPGAQHDSSPTGKVSTKLAGKSIGKLPKNDLKNEGLLGSDGSNAYGKLHSQAADLVGDGFSKVSEGKDLPSLELNLKRQRSTAEGRAAATQDDRNFLRRSNLSAFSRYHASAQAPTEYAGSCSPLGNSSVAVVKTDTTQNMTYNSNAAPLDQGSNGSCDNNDMGSTTNMPAIHTSAFHPVVQHRTPPQATKEKIADVAGVLHQVQVQHIHHYYHRHHPHVHNMPPDLKDVAFNSRVPAADGGVVNTEGDNAGVERNENGSASGSGVDQNWLSQREVALHKFRQKRKERNFQKKVRYQSRKRLAEQRPRVRGQFVRQAMDEPTSWEADS